LGSIDTVQHTEKNGPIAGLTVVNGDEDIMLITDKGVMIRFAVDSVSQTGRATLGVRLIKVDDDSIVSTMAKIEEEEVDESSDDDNASSDNTSNSDNDDKSASSDSESKQDAPSDGETSDDDSGDDSEE